MVEAIHQAGAKTAIEVQTGRGRADGVSVSEWYNPRNGTTSRALTTVEIEELIVDHGEATRRAKQAGFDGIMIHGGPGRLISDFLSPTVNKRTDKYGGDINSRATYYVELIKESKKKAGNDYPVIARLTCDHRIGSGYTIDEAKLVCQLLEKAGADAIDVTSGSFERPYYGGAGPRDMPKGFNIPLAAEIKKGAGSKVTKLQSMSY